MRPVADLPLEGLEAASSELAKAWAAALILARPLSAIAGVPLEELVRDGPRVCVQVLRALQSDAELERLADTGETGGDAAAAATLLGSFAAAGGTRSVIAAVEALRGVLWDALAAELRRPVLDRAGGHLLSDLADRLAYVCFTVLGAGLPAAPRGGRIGRDGGVLVAGMRGPRPGPVEGEPAAPARARAGGDVVIVDERPSPAAPSAARVVVARGASAGRAAEHDGGPSASWASSPGTAPASAAEHASWADAAIAEDRPPGPFARPTAEPQPPDSERVGRATLLGAEAVIQIRDERAEEGPAAWIRSIGRELERFSLEGRPFAVLLIELMDAERLGRSEPPEELARLGGEVQRTLESELWGLSERAGATLTREAPGRFWLLAPGIEASRVRAVAEQVEHAVRRSVSHRGEPVEIAVGAAVCPADGTQAAALAAHADIALYAARSGGSAGDGAAG